MIVPDEFKRLASGFYQGSDREVSTLQAWIASALKSLDMKEREVLKKFLTDILTARVDEAELQRIWNGTASDYYISGAGGMRAFLAVIRDSIVLDRE